MYLEGRGLSSICPRLLHPVLACLSRQDAEDTASPGAAGGSRGQPPPNRRPRGDRTPQAKRKRTAPGPHPKPPRASPKKPAFMTEPADGDFHDCVWSITITPQKPKGRLIAPDDGEKLAISAENIVLLRGLMVELYDSGIVTRYHFAVERGEINENPHNQGAINSRSRRTPEDIGQYLDARIRQILGYTRGRRRVDNISLHIDVKPLGTQSELYQYGYTFKDRRESWYTDCGDGYDEEFKQKAQIHLKLQELIDEWLMDELLKD